MRKLPLAVIAFASMYRIWGIAPPARSMLKSAIVAILGASAAAAWPVLVAEPCRDLCVEHGLAVRARGDPAIAGGEVDTVAGSDHHPRAAFALVRPESHVRP